MPGTYTQDSIRAVVNKHKEFFQTGKTLDVNWRKQQLRKLKQAIIDREDELSCALASDLGRDRFESYLCDLGPVIMEINEAIRSLKKWSRPERHFSGLACFPSICTKVYKMPYGVSLIISPFNFPVYLSFAVLAASMAGGNTTVIKTSSKSSACSTAIRKLISETFDEQYVTVIDGGHDIADFLLDQKFDKIFYTGSPAVGRHVMEKAAKNLTPVALELGGENGNWCIVRKDADLRDAARKIAFFKMLNAGQICININQVAVAEEVADAFLEALKQEFERQIGPNAISNPEYPNLITRAAFEKCNSVAEKYRDRIIFGGYGNIGLNKFAPTIIYPVGVEEEIVKSELFNPLLPVVKYKDAEVDGLLDTISRREHALALYIFTSDLRWARRTMSTMQYGGGCINEVCIHLMVKGVPFNGTGHSGMGAYHGEWGFREFTHPQTVLEGHSRFNLALREHPYGQKLSLIRKVLK